MKAYNLPPDRGLSSTTQDEARPPVSTEGGLPLKTCPRCSSVLPAAIPHFRKDSAKADGLTCRCSECLRTADRKRYTPEKLRLWRLDHPDMDSKYNAHKYKRHRSKILSRNERWRVQNPDKKRAVCQRRRARLIGADGWDYTTAEHIAARWAMWGNKCYLCGADAEETDHVIPLARGGSHWPSNLRPICGKCNREKGWSK